MTARDFCYWLQGFFELSGITTNERRIISSEQAICIKRHLAMVFKHEIDPSFGGKEHQAELGKLHQGLTLDSTPQSASIAESIDKLIIPKC